MFKNIVPDLVSLETEIPKIRGFYFGASSDIYEKIHSKNIFHYKVCISNNITIPDDYDFRNGHFYKKGTIWYYKRKIGFITLKFSYDQKNKIFLYNSIYSFIPFEIGHIFPPGRHLADLITFDLFLKGYVLIRGSAARYQDKNLAFIAPSYNGKTSLIKEIIDKGGKYIAEEFYIFNIKSHNIFSTPCLISDERLINRRLKQKLFLHNTIKGISRVDKFILYLNRSTNKEQYKKIDFFDFIILRSLFFFKSDFVKSYMFTERAAKKIFENINNIKKLNLNYKIIYINNYQFDDLLNDK